MIGETIQSEKSDLIPTMIVLIRLVIVLGIHVTPKHREIPHLVTFIEGLAKRATPVPTLYAIRLLSEQLESALNILLQSHELQEIFSQKTREKDEIHECLQRVMQRFQDFLMIDLRR